MENDLVSVIVCRVGQAARVEEVVDTLSTYQAIVGGKIEGWRISECLHLICHGEGMMIGLPLNRVFASVGPVHGDFVVTRLHRGETESVREGDLEEFERLAVRPA